jgi:hypothetical protein
MAEIYTDAAGKRPEGVISEATGSDVMGGVMRE